MSMGSPYQPKEKDFSDYIKERKRQLKRYKERLVILERKYNGNETQLYNFYGGQSLGYIQGKIDVLEDLIDFYEGDL